MLKPSLLTLLVILSAACQKEAVDDQKPVIDPGFMGAFPTQCDTIYAGETFTFKARFTDNTLLGSYSLDIHNNFDHHSHSTDVEECQLSPVKEPADPFVFIHEYEIPAGTSDVEVQTEIHVPDGVDEGDYHFFISLTDREGWRAEKGISIKILYRQPVL